MFIMSVIKFICFILGYLPCAISDIKCGKIPVWLPASLSVFLIALMVWQSKAFPTKMLFAILPGLILIIISKVSKELIGMGDGIMVIFSGVLSGYKEAIMILSVALIFAAVFSLILLVMKKANRKTKIRFVPFLLVSHSLVAICLL